MKNKQKNENKNYRQQGVYFTLGCSPISQLIGFGDTAYRGIGTLFQSPAQNTPPAVASNAEKKTQNICILENVIIFVDVNYLKMKAKNAIKAVSISAVKHANKKLMSRGVVVKGRNASNGTITVRIERGTLNHKRVVSSEEIKNAFKIAIENNA
ncbi:MAG: hypothetical protein RBR97_13220 [Bacteroidales bacterium]|nr:hypothetical protein [Bacteroidales bacterium]